jgi:UDP-glucuronate 4-epimerase
VTASAGDAQRHVLVTGVAGFIGMHTARALLDAGATVTGVDSFEPYYDVALKAARLATLEGRARFRFVRLDLADAAATAALFRDAPPGEVVHLAAQPGVRHSLVAPDAYVRNNLTAFGHVLEGCRHAGVAHLVYASSSSVYGADAVPFSEDQRIDTPVSLYAATKAANELMAHSYSHLFRLPTTGLRFFTVYGPWGRPDQAPMLFTDAILAGRPIAVFNHGRMQRDFTYIDDIVEGVVRTLACVPGPRADSGAPHAIYNIGNHQAVELETFIATLERLLGRAAVRDYRPMQPGDVPATYASIDRLRAATGFAPHTPLDEGLARFVAWYRDYYRTPAARAGDDGRDARMQRP